MKEQNYLDHLVGVFGQPVAENPGVIIQDAAFAAMGLERWHFLTLDVDKDQLENAINGLKAFKMRGINCTIPHKIAVNTDGRLYGDNTDGKGLMMSLESNGIDVKGKRIVVLGAGGAARAICVELALAGAAHITIVSRPGPKNLGPSLLEILQTRTSVDAETNDWVGTYKIPAGTDIVVNATSVGLYPNVDAIPNFDLDSLTRDMFVQDVIPNPTETSLIKELRRRGIRCETGAGMLINQAAMNIEMWTGRKPDKTVMYRALEEALA